jgi:agmatinase
VSYHTGAVFGPSAILDASTQVDLFIKEIPDAWKSGIAMLPIPHDIIEESKKIRTIASEHIRKFHSDEPYLINDPLLIRINQACETLNIYVKSITQKLLDEGKLVVLLGGDHSTPLGFLRALSERYERFGILQIDAHADLRKAYQGFTFSHASIMYNALKLAPIKKLVQVGIRDYCEEEMIKIHRSKGRIVTFFDEEIKSASYLGKNWDTICNEIIDNLPDLVYISFDIDGLDPKLCPNTGTPVPGGLEFDQVTYLIRKLVRSGRKIIGMDLNEVAGGGSNDWDANVGARMLYQLCNWMILSRKEKAIKK